MISRIEPRDSIKSVGPGGGGGVGIRRLCHKYLVNVSAVKGWKDGVVARAKQAFIHPILQNRFSQTIGTWRILEIVNRAVQTI